MCILSFLLLFQAAEAEVQETVPVRVTPPVYSVQHPFVQFTGGSRLISLMSGEDEEGQPKCVIASVQVSIAAVLLESFVLEFKCCITSTYSNINNLNLIYFTIYFLNCHVFLLHRWCIVMKRWR